MRFCAQPLQWCCSRPNRHLSSVAQLEMEAIMQDINVQDAISALLVGATTSAAPTGMAKLKVLHREATQSLPQQEAQEIRVLLATLEPGDRTPYHSHRFPVTVFMLSGEFTLELDGRDPVILHAGNVFVEPSLVAMTGHNRSERPTTMALFYVSDPDTPFADAIS